MDSVKTILITGASGALGRELAYYLSILQQKIIPTSRDYNSGFYLDVSDLKSLHSFLKEKQPDLIIHLAAMVPIALVEQNHDGAIATNIAGLDNTLNSVKHSCPQAKVIVTSSSEVYGNGNYGKKFEETDPYSPNNLYAFTKVAQEELSKLYVKNGLNIKIARIFNYSSIYKKPVYSLESFANQIAEIIKKGGEKRITVGDLRPERDFLNGQDVASALIAIAMNQSPHTVFNVCRGSTVSMESLLKSMVKEFGTPIDIQEDPTKLRTIDNYYVCGDNSRLLSLGWVPRIDVDKMIKILVGHYKKLYSV